MCDPPFISVRKHWLTSLFHTCSEQNCGSITELLIAHLRCSACSKTDSSFFLSFNVFIFADYALS